MANTMFIYTLRTLNSSNTIATFSCSEDAHKLAEKLAKRPLEEEWYLNEDETCTCALFFEQLDGDGYVRERTIFVIEEIFYYDDMLFSITDAERLVAAANGENFMRKHRTEIARCFEEKRTKESFQFNWGTIQLWPEYEQPAGVKHPRRVRFSDASWCLLDWMTPKNLSTMIYSGRESYDGYCVIHGSVEEGIKTFLNYKRNNLPIGFEDNGDFLFGVQASDIYFELEPEEDGTEYYPLRQKRSNIFVEADSVPEEVRTQAAAVLQKEREAELSHYRKEFIPIEVYLEVTGNNALLKTLEEGLK